MNYDIPKTQNKPQFVVEKPFSAIAKEDHANNDHAGHNPFEWPDLGGYISIGTSSTAASGVSLSMVPTYTINFMPKEGVIPSHEIQVQHLGRVLEQIVNPAKNRV